MSEDEEDSGWQLLHVASINGDISLAEKVLNSSINLRLPDLSIMDMSKRTPLHYASEIGCLEIVKMLFKAVNDVVDRTPSSRRGQKKRKKKQKMSSALDKNNRTPLHEASLNGHTEVVELLLKAKADLLVADKTKRTALYDASFNGHDKIVRMLLEAEADASVVDEDGRTALHVASSAGHSAVVTVLLQFAKSTVQHPSTLDKRTPLHDASLNGHLEVVKSLLNAEANPLVIDKDYRTPLHDASFNGHTAVVQELLYESDPNAMNKDNRTPLHNASLNGHEAIVKALVEAGASVSSIDRKNKTPLHFASWTGHKGVVKMLLRANANPSVSDQDNKTPLHYASLSGNEPIVEILLKAGAYPSPIDKDNRTPLHYMSLNGNEAIVKLLLNFGANPLTIDKDYKTPLDIASCNRHVSIAEMLRKAEGDSFAPSNKIDGIRIPDIGQCNKKCNCCCGQVASITKDMEILHQKLSYFQRIESFQIQEFIYRNQHKNFQGIVFVIAMLNDSSTCRVQSTFEALNFIVYTVENADCTRINNIVEAASAMNYPKQYEYIVFYYAGPGGRDDQGPFIVPYNSTGCKDIVIHVENCIVEPFRHMTLTRLFLFDCYQIQLNKDDYLFTHGKQNEKLSNPGWAIAVAFSKDQRFIEDDRTNGGLWTRSFCEKLLQEISIVNALNETSDTVAHSRGKEERPLTVLSLSTKLIIKKDTLKPVEIKDVYNCLLHKASQWNHIALKLGINPDDFIDSGYSDRLKLYELIKKWITAGVYEVSWAKLVSATRDMGWDAESEHLKVVSTA